MKIVLIITLAVSFTILFACDIQGRTWTDVKGKKITADYVSILQLDEPKVKLQKLTGEYVLVPLRNLCDEDQDYIRRLNGQSTPHHPKASNSSNNDDNWMAPTDTISQSVVFPVLKNLNIDSKEAYDALIQLRDEDPTRLEPDYTIGLLFVFNKKDYLHAQKHFMRCLKNCPEDIGTHINLGTICILAGKYPDAYTYYQKAFKLGGFNPTLCHNIFKFNYLSGSNAISLSDVVRKKFVQLANEISKKGSSPTFNPKQGWMFVMCSEGRSHESQKKEWFRIANYRPYEFPICIKCGGTGIIFCPANNCSGGKVAYTVNKTYTFPNGDKATMPTRMYRTCEVCHGKNRVTCPKCKGSGEEYRTGYRDNYPSRSYKKNYPSYDDY